MISHGLNERAKNRIAHVTEPSTLNRVALEAMLRGRVLLFAGVLYNVPPVPMLDALELDRLRFENARLAEAEWTPANHAQQIRIMLAGARLYRRLVRPARGWRRVLWPLMRNPFRRIAADEWGGLLRFFSMCRTTPIVRQ